MKYVIYSKRLKAYWHNRNGWIKNPVNAHIYDNTNYPAFLIRYGDHDDAEYLPIDDAEDFSPKGFSEGETVREYPQLVCERSNGFVACRQL